MDIGGTAMLISVSELFKLENSEKKISESVDLSSVSFSPLPVSFRTPVSVEGKLKNAGGVITLEAEAKGEYETVCDRCGCAIKESIRFDIRENYVRNALKAEECDEDTVVLKGQEIDLTKTVGEFAFSAMPTKHLCCESCKGLCPKCGKNLNEGACGCKDDEWDPRFEALRGLFD